VKLWPHQERGIRDLRDALVSLDEGEQRVLGVSPTGSGKTVLGAEMCSLAVAKGSRVLWMAHTRELVDQPVAEFRSHGLHVGIVQASRRADPTAPVQVGTVQTLARRDVVPEADLVVIDEAHLHVATQSIQRTLAHYPHAQVIGLSATPWRLDGRAMDAIYRRIVTIARPSELIEAGILVPARMFRPSVPDLSKVKHAGGDFEQRGLAEACNKSQLIGDIVSTYLRHAQGMSTILFAVSVEHSIACRDALLAAGVPAEHVDATTPDSERDAVLARLRSGETKVVCNVQILTTGFDHKGLQCIICARPTESVALWVQMCGRALRAANGKRAALILDHSDNTLRLGAPHADREWTLEGKAKRKAAPVVGTPLKLCQQCFAVVPSHLSRCPECNTMFVSQSQSVTTLPGMLVEVSYAPTPDQKRTEFYRLCEVGRTLSRDFVKRQFHKKFGHWPKGYDWPAWLPLDVVAERIKLERVAASKGFGSRWVENRIAELSRGGSVAVR